MMKISVVAIGDELLIGQVVDTNSGDIARRIASAGWSLTNVLIVHDDATSIRQAIERAMATSDVVITTGGLGPTKDDITKTVLTEIFGGTLHLDFDVLANIESVFRRRHLKLNNLTREQAMVPTSCKVVQNRLGTAPVMWFERGDKVLVAMPGVPFEMRHAFNNDVFPMLFDRFGQDGFIEHRTFIVYGITESDLAERLANFESSLAPALHLAYLPVPGYIRLRLDGTSSNKKELSHLINDAVAKLKKFINDYILTEEDITPEQYLFNLLSDKSLTIATAESCTGGNIAHRLTLLPGISSVYYGGIVSYTNEMKINTLGVDRDTLETHGAVSEPVVVMMAEGARKISGADCAIATSGIAGPGGGTAEKSVGTVCMAFSTPYCTEAITVHLPGDRQRVIERASTTALIEMALRIKAIQPL